MHYLLHIDGNILLFIQEYVRHSWMDSFWKAVTFLGNSGWFWIAVSLLLIVPKKTRKIGITALAALILGALMTNVALKNLVQRVRPFDAVQGLIPLVKRPLDSSFPSGHACASFAAALVYYRMLPKIWGIGALVLAALIAFSRLYVGVHYPSDVLAGLIVGVLAAWAAMRLTEYIWKNRPHKHVCQ